MAECLRLPLAAELRCNNYDVQITLRHRKQFATRTPIILPSRTSKSANKPRLSLNRAAVLRFRLYLESLGLSPWDNQSTTCSCQ